MPTGEDGGYREFMATVDAIVTGRASSDTVLTFDAWPYGTSPVHVMSRQAVLMPDALQATVSSFAGNPPERVARLQRSGAPHLHRRRDDNPVISCVRTD